MPEMGSPSPTREREMQNELKCADRGKALAQRAITTYGVLSSINWVSLSRGIINKEKTELGTKEGLVTNRTGFALAYLRVEARKL